MSPIYPGRDGYTQMHAPYMLGSQASMPPYSSSWGFYGNRMTMQEREACANAQMAYVTRNESSGVPERRVDPPNKRNEKTRSGVRLECPRKRRGSESFGQRNYRETPFHDPANLFHCPDPPFWRENQIASGGSSASMLQDPHEASRGMSVMKENEDDRDSRYESKVSSAREHILWSRKHRSEPGHRP